MVLATTPSVVASHADKQARAYIGREEGDILPMIFSIVFLTGISDGISSEVVNAFSMWLSCFLGVSGGRCVRVIGFGGSGTVPNDTLPTVAFIGCRGAASLRNDSTGCN